MHKRIFKQGEVMLREGESGSGLFVVKTGTVHIYKGNVPVATQTEPGGVYGEMSVLLNSPHTATVRAATEVIAIEVPDADQFLKAKPDACYKVMVSMARRLQAITLQLAELRAGEESAELAGRLEEAAVAAPTAGPLNLESGSEHYEVEVIEPGSEEYPEELRS